MKIDKNSLQPLFQQFVSLIEEQILLGDIKEEGKIPSINRLADIYSVNPSTVAKGYHLLVKKGIIHKKKGIGFYVNKGAKKSVLIEKRRKFTENSIPIVLDEAEKIGITKEELIVLLSKKRKTYENNMQK